MIPLGFYAYSQVGNSFVRKTYSVIYLLQQMAISQAAELRLSSEECICQDATEEGRSRARQTFWSVVWLEIISCTGTHTNGSLVSTFSLMTSKQLMVKAVTYVWTNARLACHIPRSSLVGRYPVPCCTERSRAL